jgi:prepilin-type N-terminal cleavage/methylation domain-containing protein
MNNKGFTLLELIVVLIVMAALIAIALPQYVGFVERGRAAEAITACGALKAAEEATFISRNAYDTVIANLGITLIQTNWTYTITLVGLDGYQVSCARQNTQNCPAAQVGQTVVMNYNRTTGVTAWTGTHPGSPR